MTTNLESALWERKVMSQFSVQRAHINLPKLPEWARQLRRTVRSAEELSDLSVQAENELPKLAVLPKVWCFCVFSIVISLVFLMTFQYAGIVEVQYELNRAQSKLAALKDDQLKLKIEVEKLSSVERISPQAIALGMEVPRPDKVHLVKLHSSASNGEVKAVYYPPVRKK
ncbi:MAG: hypothetical protein ACI38Q_03445 [Candidatus Bruticola sp.]